VGVCAACIVAECEIGHLLLFSEPPPLVLFAAKFVINTHNTQQRFYLWNKEWKYMAFRYCEYYFLLPWKFIRA